MKKVFFDELTINQWALLLAEEEISKSDVDLLVDHEAVEVELESLKEVRKEWPDFATRDKVSRTISLNKEPEDGEDEILVWVSKGVFGVQVKRELSEDEAENFLAAFEVIENCLNEDDDEGDDGVDAEDESTSVETESEAEATETTESEPEESESEAIVSEEHAAEDPEVKPEPESKKSESDLKDEERQKVIPPLVSYLRKLTAKERDGFMNNLNDFVRDLNAEEKHKEENPTYSVAEIIIALAWQTGALGKHLNYVKMGFEKPGEMVSKLISIYGKDAKELVKNQPEARKIVKKAKINEEDRKYLLEWF